MTRGGTLRIHGTVSGRLLAATDRIQQFYLSLLPWIKRVKVEVDGILEDGENDRRRDGGIEATTFTGGVDSFHTLFSHRDTLRLLVFAHGHDIPLEESSLRHRVSRSLQLAARRVGLPLLEIETNVRSFSNPLIAWDHYHGAAVAALGLLLSGTAGTFYIPATYAGGNLFPYGSHPDLDPLFSTERVRIVHDGCDRTRPEKIATLVSHDVFLETLRVCWKNPGGAYNCGRCHKCLRTMADLRLNGALERCTTFAEPFSIEELLRLPLRKRSMRAYFEDTLAFARRVGTDPELEAALEQLLRSRDPPSGFSPGMARQ
jgi:hypothetical protein